MKEQEINLQHHISDALHNLVPFASACNFSKINTPPWVFFMFFKLYKCYQIAQRITHYYMFIAKRLTNLTWLKLPRNSSVEQSNSIVKQSWEHLAACENIKNLLRITAIYSKRKQKDKFSMFNVINNKGNMRQYFCQCFRLLRVIDLKLIPPHPPTKKAFQRPCTMS